MPERRVAPGDYLTITAAHDTYGLSFTVSNDTAGDAPVGWEPAPLQVLLAASCMLLCLSVLPYLYMQARTPPPQSKPGEGLGAWLAKRHLRYDAQQPQRMACRTPHGRLRWRAQTRPTLRWRVGSRRARWSSGRSRVRCCAWPRAHTMRVSTLRRPPHLPLVC